MPETAVATSFTDKLTASREAARALATATTAQKNTALRAIADAVLRNQARVLQANGKGYYRHEMTDSDHLDLLRVLLELEGMVVISGYDSELYRDRLSGWETFQTTSRISAGRGTALRTETVWINPACSDALHCRQMPMFGEEVA